VTPKPSVDTLIQEAQVAEQEGRRADSRVLFERALYSLKRAQDGQLATSILRWVARSHQLDGDADAALDCLDASIAIAVLGGDSGAIGQAMNAQATVHGQLGDLDQAESLNLEARARAVAAGDTRLAAMTALDLGVIAQIRGDHETTLRYFRTSLGEFRSVGAPKDVLSTLISLGKLFTELERWDDAIRAFDEAVQIAEAIGDRLMRITLEVNRAELEILRGDLTSARHACELALSLSAQTPDAFAGGEIARQLGAIARETGELPAAEAHFERAHQIAQQRNDSLLLAETARERAELSRRQGRHRDALTHLNRGHRILTQLRATRVVADVDHRTGRLERLFLEVVRHWSGSIESKDRYTQGHCERVADIACAPRTPRRSRGA
jgi:tetratricopeptide (TPR) repeat protein